MNQKRQWDKRWMDGWKVQTAAPKNVDARLMSHRTAKIPNKVGICQTDTQTCRQTGSVDPITHSSTKICPPSPVRRCCFY